MIEFIVILVFISIQIQVILRYIKKTFLLNKYKTIVTMLNDFLDHSYNSVYQDQIIGYTSNGMKEIPKSEMETIERNFIKLSLELLGPRNIEILIDFFGTKEVLIQNCLFFIRERLAQDTLTKIVQDMTPPS